MSYRPRRAARAETLTLRGLAHRLLRFGPANAQPAVFLHGWADSAATFQFLIDAFVGEHAIVALDWRGFGGSAWAGTPYWFPDYIADLEALLNALDLRQPVTLLGHSMGGNVASLYSGIRPERVRAVINLEGCGLTRTTPDAAPVRYQRWLDELQTAQAFGRFPNAEEFGRYLERKNPRLTAERARFVADSWSRVLPDGGIGVNSDPAHKLINPVLYRREEAEACWRRATAPTLLVVGALSDYRVKLGADGTDEYFRSVYPQLSLETLAGAGHMLHHDEPEALARLVEPWLEGRPAGTP